MNTLIEIRIPEQVAPAQVNRIHIPYIPGISREVVREYITKIDNIVAGMKEVWGPYNGEVHVHLDEWSSSIFWAIVLFRPIKLPGWGSTTVYDHLERQPWDADALTKSQLGLVYDRDRNYLALIWKEALKERGILGGMENVASWKEVLRKYTKRTKLGEMTPKAMHFTALRHSFAVPPDVLRKLCFATQLLWHRGKAKMDDFVVFDLNAVDIVHVEGLRKGFIGEAASLPPIAVNVAHMNVTNKELFCRTRKLSMSLRRKASTTEEECERHNERAKAYAKRKRAEIKEKRNPDWVAATRIVCKLGTLFGAPVRRGRYPRQLHGAQAREYFVRAADNYVYGRSGIVNQREVDRLVDQLHGYIARSPCIPPEFEHWLMFKKDQNYLADYVRCLVALPPEFVEVEKECSQEGESDAMD